MDDPWNWNTDRVVQELCTPNRSWRPSSTPLKFPPLDQLEKALREHEVDGEVLMTCDQVDLYADLGIKILKHKSALKNAVRDLRSLSHQYRLYLKRQISEPDDDMDDVAAHDQQSDESRDKAPSEARTQAPSHNGFENVPDPKTPVLKPAPSPDASSAHEQPPKRRKIQPSFVTAEIDPDRNRNIATEADVLRFESEFVPESAAQSRQETVDDNSNALHDSAYLGPKSVTRFDIVGLDSVERSEPLEKIREINFVSTVRPPPGRQIQTYRLVKRRLLYRPRHRRIRVKSDMVRGSNDPDHDEVLPLYGESDDDMDFDSDTWREIEAERHERENQPKAKGLTLDQIRFTFQKVLAQMASEWRATKLPKCTSRANRIWNDCRRLGLKDSIDKAQRDLRDLDARIAKWKETIEKNEYRNVGELEYALSTFEPSVFDREHRTWLIGVLTSPFEPAKIPRSRQPIERRPRQRSVLADDEEILTSDSDDDLRDFIVDDEADIPAATDSDSIQTTGKSHIEHSEDPDIVMGENDDIPVVDDPRLDSDGDHNMLPQADQFANRTSPARNSRENVKTPSNLASPVVIDLTSSPERASRVRSSKGSKTNTKKTPTRGKGDGRQTSLIMSINDLPSAEQKVANAMSDIDPTYINAIFSIAHYRSPERIWRNLIIASLEQELPKAPYDDRVKKDGLIVYSIIRFFESYRDDESYRLSRYKNLDHKGQQRLREIGKSFSKDWAIFFDFLKRLSDRFQWTRTSLSHYTEDPKQKDTDSYSEDSDIVSDNGIDDSSSVLPSDRKKRGKKKRRKRREVIRDREAAMVRKVDHAGVVEREHRRKLLRERLMAEGDMGVDSQQGRVIVNESKKDDQGFIYIHDEIAPRIKEHQVTGVRFMWDQLLVAEKRQGCLLAHTMGLGKTMQVITLLVAIHQAAVSDDPTISSQVPEEMRESKTLILCPATLVNNWLDEMLAWLPEGHGLGDIFKIDAVLGHEQRSQVIQTWGEQGGVLIIGYNLFKSIVEEDMRTRDILLKWPSIVVADEAHVMKSPKSKTHVAAANFSTLSRVALTGSPLANNVEEYYSMINWVAPNYLGDIREFRSQYATPINQGLHVEATDGGRRHALRILRVLKSEVAPKVSRITIRALKHDMPPKKEFVITVPLTEVQKQAYVMFIEFHRSQEKHVPTFAIHDLSLICASPSIFLEKLRGTKADAGGNSATVVLPRQLISEEMALLGSAVRRAQDEFALSWKVAILFQIIEQCKKQNDKLLLFSHSVVVLDYLEGALRMKRYSLMRLDGQTQMTDRQNLINRFNKGKEDVFLISTKAGSLGLNITSANRVVIFDASFNPQNEQQAVGRAYRIGQKKPVYVYRFVCGGTCEQKTLNQAVWKMQLASRVVDKKHPIPKAERVSAMWDMPEEPRQEDLDQHLGKDPVIDEILKQDKYRKGIRAIQMMDVFEEEAIEEAELSAEDVMLADQMIQANALRRTNTGGHGPGVPQQASFARHSSGSHPPALPHMPPPLAAMVAIPNGGQYSAFPQKHSLTANPMGDRVPPQQSPFTGDLTGGQPASLQQPPPSLDPIQMPGAEVHVRSRALDVRLDPDNLQTALQRTNSEQPDQSKSTRIDDKEAMLAVFERRGGKLKTEQEASRPHRLPHWAKDVVRQGQIPAPSSSITPKMPPSPTSRSNHRTPFSS
ncbi:hypothetical protein GGR50DRAFT_56597 [Xylaria sp. CBS 124048]|nr:hypothetical protein GGR50DRAFT_56597 [Xylaria sp. CBS 124048]